jgi:hypothetical protein
MAIDIISIPPASAEPERTFSGARHILSWDRLRLTAENLERLECIGNWRRNGHINTKNIIAVMGELDEMEGLLDEEYDGLEETNGAKPP